MNRSEVKIGALVWPKDKGWAEARPIIAYDEEYVWVKIPFRLGHFRSCYRFEELELVEEPKKPSERIDEIYLDIYNKQGFYDSIRYDAIKKFLDEQAAHKCK